MKKTSLLIIFLFAVTMIYAQNTSEIIFNENKEVILNGQKIDTTTDLETIKSLLGEPIIYKEYVTGKVNYHFTELGIAIHLVNGKLKFIGANFNWDGDETFPETSYIGKFSIDTVAFNKNSTEDVLSKIKIIDFMSVMSGLYMTNPEKEKIAAIIGFKEEKVTQIGFEFQ